MHQEPGHIFITGAKKGVNLKSEQQQSDPVVGRLEDMWIHTALPFISCSTVLHIEKPNQMELIQVVKSSYTCNSDMLRRTLGSLWVQVSCKTVIKGCRKVLLKNVKQDKVHNETKETKFSFNSWYIFCVLHFNIDEMG